MVVGAALALPAVDAGACGAQGGDNRSSDQATRCQQSAAVQPAAGAPGATTNPVDIITGNKFFAQADARLSGGLTLLRFYNSRHTFKSVLGPGWRHGFEASVSVRAASAGRAASAQIVQGDGRRIVFERLPGASPDTYIALNPAYGSLHHQPMLGPDRRWRWQWRDGARLSFTETGRLSSVSRPDGVLLSMQYAGDDGTLAAVRNRYGETLRFNYGRHQGLLTSVDLPDGQKVRYRYDAHGTLVGVLRNDVPQWRFELADHHFSAITGVRNRHGNLVRRVRYDEQGRAIYSSAGHDAQAIHLRYGLPGSSDQPGQTIVSWGSEPVFSGTYRWRYNAVTQQRALLEASGERCPVCPPTDIARQYDQKHRLTGLDTGDGIRLRVRYDKLGRVRERTSYQRTGRSRGRPAGQLLTGLHARYPSGSGGASTATVHYDYATMQADAQPSRIRWPSLAPGREHVLSFERDRLDRVTAVTESGFAPVLGSLQERAGRWHFERWRAIRRRWTISYVEFGAAAGLPAIIDGPLRGPKDQIRFVYDRQGRQIARFGPYRQSWQYQWTPGGMLAGVTASEGSTRTYRYDQFNRLIAYSRDGVYTRLERSPEKSELTILPSDRPALTILFNDLGLPVRFQDAHRNTLQLTEKPMSEITGRRSHRGPFVSAGNPVLAATRLQGRPASGEYRLSWHDDFGRQIAVLDSATGAQMFAYDQASRPIARVNDSGQMQLYRYAPNGKFSGIAAPDPGGWLQRFKRGRIVRHVSAHQHTRRRLDEHRRVVQTRFEYQDSLTGQRFARPLVLNKRYDSHGRLTQRDIGRGWSVQYRWNGQNELAGLMLSRRDDPDTKALASSLEWQAFTGGRAGLLAAQWGNGTSMRLGLDSKMRVASVRNINRHIDDPLPEVALHRDAFGRIVEKSVGSLDSRFTYDKNGWLSGYDSAIGSARWQYRADGTRVDELLAPASPAPDSTPVSMIAKWPSQSVRVPATKTVIVAPSGAIVVTGRHGRPQWVATRARAVYRYLYNPTGERIGRLRLDNPNASRWYVYENRRLAIETDAHGNPLRSFLYLDGKPFAIVQFNNDDASVSWVHTDQVGMPVATTNTEGKVTWKGHFDPFGQYLDHPENERPDEAMPLRLPGQLLDPETGYHDNYLRTYDPTRGRYLGPDPLGLRKSGLRYAYARNSPLDVIDPLGLYEVDMHYYSTFVIAVAAGMSYEDARTIANANQHVDDNPATQPIIEDRSGGQSWFDTFMNRAQVLRDWHFVLETRVENPDGSFTIVRNDSTDISNPDSPRLTTLRNWVDSAADQSRALQMFRLGVYSHAYMDTAAHRDPDNRPVPVSPALFGPGADRGVGHAPYLHYPDYTYNTCDDGTGGGELPSDDPDIRNPVLHWPNNEARTLTIQQDMYEIFRRYTGGGEARATWEELSEQLERFNAIQENSQGTFFDGTKVSEKLELLERFVEAMQLRTPVQQDAVRFVSSSAHLQNSAYDRELAESQWAELFSEPNDE